MTKITKLLRRGYGNPLFAIPTGALFTVLGLYAIYTSGISLTLGVVAMGGIFFLAMGIYNAVTPGEDEDDW